MNSTITDARDAFLDNLHAMATGSYLREEDKEFWEPPYPESVVNEARVTLDSLIDATASAPAGDAEAFGLAIRTALNELLALSDKHEGAVLEDEELEDFTALVRALCVEHGVEVEPMLNEMDAVLEEEE